MSEAKAGDVTMSRADEFAAKRERLRAYLDREQLAGVILRNRSNTAWLGCGPADNCSFSDVQGGRSEIWLQSETGVGYFVVTPETIALVTENIELPRISRDEFFDLPIEVIGQAWHESGLVDAATSLIGRGEIAVDTLDIASASALADAGLSVRADHQGIAALRAELLPRERERYCWLGQTAARVIGNVCRDITAGVREVEVVADAARRLALLGATQEVPIVCSDDRLMIDRHGLYGDYEIRRAAMVVFCAHKWGLVANVTRMVYLDDIPDAIKERHQALSAFDAELMRATKPGVPLADIFTKVLQPGYANLGAPDAWLDHHQGGSTGYAGRDTRVTLESPGEVHLHQAFAWNPSLPGIKSEDTFLVTEDGYEVLTDDPSWPAYADSGRPAILSLA